MDPIYVELQATSARAALEVAAASSESRTIAGTIVPYGETADLGIGVVEFLHGSVAPLRERTPLVLGHDVNLPVGILSGNTFEHADQGAEGSFAIDPTAAGDDALAQAQSGSRAGFSVGAILDDFEQGDDGVIRVSAARVVHVGLVTIPAYASADVAAVAAELASGTSHNRGGTAMEPTPIPTPEPPVAGHITPSDAPAVAAAERPIDHERPTILATARPTPELRPGDGARFVQAMVRAQAGDRDALAYVEAALSEVATADIPGIVPPAYTTEILHGIEVERVLADRVAVRRPMPASGMKITKPGWTTLPNGGWVAELAETPSNKPEIDPEEVAILEWAYGVALSYAATQRSTPDALDAIFRAAVQDYYSDVEQKIADALLAEDTPTGAGATLGAAVAAGFTATKKRPNVLLVAVDVYGDLFDDLVMTPIVGGAEGIGAELRGTIGGLEVVVSPHLPDGTEIVTRRGVVELRETDPVRLTANTIGALKVELGVTAFASFDVEEPGGIVSMTPAAGAPAGESAARKSAQRQRQSKRSS